MRRCALFGSAHGLCIVAGDLVSGHHLTEPCSLLCHCLRCGGGFLDECGILLRHLIHLHDSFIYLLNSRRLLAGSSCDFGDNIGDFLDCAHNLLKRLP